MVNTKTLKFPRCFCSLLGSTKRVWSYQQPDAKTSHPLISSTYGSSHVLVIFASRFIPSPSSRMTSPGPVFLAFRSLLVYGSPVPLHLSAPHPSSTTLSTRCTTMPNPALRLASIRCRCRYTYTTVIESIPTRAAYCEPRLLEGKNGRSLVDKAR